MSCTAAGNVVTCTAGQCESGYALNSEANDINSACVGKMSLSIIKIIIIIIIISIYFVKRHKVVTSEALYSMQG